ncbi:MAG: hypothetical protein HY081_10460 [Gammaproteobacteria bacterium]|nr:hypothetical protein [Gammaproteobacteria bacterium]
MNIFAKTTVLTFSVLALSSVGYAANYNSSSSSSSNVNAQSFEQLDKNKDGVLDKKEARAAGLNVKKTDTDKDGKISRSEYETAVAMGHGGKDANPSTSESMSDIDSVRNGTLPGVDSSSNASQNNSSNSSYGSQSSASDSGTSSSGNTSNSMGGASRNGTGSVPDTTSSSRSSRGY